MRLRLCLVPGRDHLSSATPQQFKQRVVLCFYIRAVLTDVCWKVGRTLRRQFAVTIKGGADGWHDDQKES